jgi:hypothetical protein
MTWFRATGGRRGRGVLLAAAATLAAVTLAAVTLAAVTLAAVTLAAGGRQLSFGASPDPSRPNGTRDTIAPSAPRALAVRRSTADSITLTWTRSRDNRSRVEYALSRDGTQAGTSLAPSFTFKGLACGKSYVLAVVAYDATRNHSAKVTQKADTAPCPSYVSTTGNDTNPCTASAPCLSFDRAYHLAKPRQQVIVAGGTYPGQTLTGDATKTSTDDVVFVAAPGQSVVLDGGLELRGASHLTVRGLAVHELEFFYPSEDITAEGIDDNGHLGIWGASNVTLRGGAVYETTPSGNDPAIGADSFGQGTHVPKNILIDGVYFHDWQLKDPTDHIECIQIWLADGLTIRNSRFRHCAHHALFINQYAPVLAGASLMRNVTIENNFFDNPNVGFYAIQIRTPNTPGVACENFLIRNNSFLQGTFIDCAGTGNRVEDNILPSIGFGNCSVAGWTYSYNLVATPQSGCGATNLAGKADFVDAATLDLHLRADSPGIDRAAPRSYAKRDVDGQLRPQHRRADIGADEYVKPS